MSFELPLARLPKLPCETSTLPAHTRCRNMQEHHFNQHLISPTLVDQHEHDEAILIAYRHSFSSATTWQDGRRTNAFRTLSITCAHFHSLCLVCFKCCQGGFLIPATVPRNIFIQSGDWQLLRPSLRYTRTRFSSQASPVPCSDASVMLRVALNLRQQRSCLRSGTRP